MTDHTAIMLLIDRSASMHTIRTATEAGINEFITGHATATGTRTIRIAQFDTHYDTVCPSTDPASIEPFHLSPRGSTALLDAIGRAITDFSYELATLPERPTTVILAIMTDGEENASRDYTLPTINTMIQQQCDDYGWHILYLGANQDAIAVAANIGIHRGQTITYAATDHGTRAVLNTVDTVVATAAAGGVAEFTDAQRADAAT